MRSNIPEPQAEASPLSVQNLSVFYRTRGREESAAVRSVSWELVPGRVLGVAGESGSGKSTAMLAAMGYRAPQARADADHVLLGGADLMRMQPAELRGYWGAEISYVAQNAALALNPSLTVGRQLTEVLRAHTELSGSQLDARRMELLGDVDIPDGKAALRRFPHQFSGGQQQRIALAIAIAAEPRVLLLDEPTTGLDVTTQARITELLRGLIEEHRMAVMYVSHDLGLLSSVADDVKIMRHGEVVESGEVHEVLSEPQHSYSRMLIQSVPDITGARRVRVQTAGREQEREPRLLATSLTCSYGGTPVVHDVSLDVRAGEIVSVVGESGSGKSTVARAVAGIHGAYDGSVALSGRELASSVHRRSRAEQRAIQMVFQNPKTALNPRHTAVDMVARAIRRFRPEVTARQRRPLAEETLARVGLEPQTWCRRPDQLSGGQCQRVALARGVVAQPKVLICDEVTSALDVSVQARILDLIVELVEETAMGVLFITHDLRVVRTLADRVVVMQRGELREQQDVDQIFETPQTEYTRSLLAAVPPLPPMRTPA